MGTLSRMQVWPSSRSDIDMITSWDDELAARDEWTVIAVLRPAGLGMTSSACLQIRLKTLHEHESSQWPAMHCIEVSEQG